MSAFFTQRDVWFYLGVFLIAFYLLCGSYGRFGISELWIWLVAGGICLGVHGVRLLVLHGVWPISLSRGWIYALSGLMILAGVAFMSIEGLVVYHAFPHKTPACDYIVVLGARVEGKKPSLALQYRIDDAYDYLVAHPDTIAIASGGQGADEAISEAQCIYEALTARGIDPARIWRETRATNTVENLKYSFAMIENPEAAIGLITNNYHVARTLLLARTHGDRNVYGMPTHFTGPLLIHYAVREAIGIPVEILRGNIRL